jgi:hypothetical protein
MRLVRTVIALALIVVGAVILSEMLRYQLRYSLTGIVLGGAMIALGAVRLRALYSRMGPP